MASKSMKKLGKIAADFVVYLFLALCIFSVVITVLSKRDADGAAEVFGYQMRIVTSDSMAACEYTDVSGFEIKSIPIRSMIFVKTMPKNSAEADEWYRSLKAGDVLTFRYVYTTQVTITHRVVSVTEKEGGFIIELAGDNTNSEGGQLYQTIDTSIPHNTNYVIGKVIGQSYAMGVVLNFLRQPAAIILLIILPCFLIIVFEVAKIVRLLNTDKKQNEREQMAKKDDELEALRRRLAELENQAAGGMAPSVGQKDRDDPATYDCNESNDDTTGQQGG